MTIQAVPEIGQNVLVVVDCNSDCMCLLREKIQQIPEITTRTFTLIHHVPPVFWEHGGGCNCEELMAIQKEAEQVWEKVENDFAETKSYFTGCCQILHETGVPAAQIHTIIASDEVDLTAAVIKELQRGNYSGVIIGQCHSETVSRLEGRGIFDAFRRYKPDATIWVMEPSA
jgi:hypothetical protein